MAYKFELQVAIEEGDFDKFLELFELSDLDCDDYDGSLLHSAASFGTLQMVEFLVAKGAEINRPGGTFRAPALTYAADCGNVDICLLYTSPSPRDRTRSRMPSSA